MTTTTKTRYILLHTDGRFSEISVDGPDAADDSIAESKRLLSERVGGTVVCEVDAALRIIFWRDGEFHPSQPLAELVTVGFPTDE